MLHQCIHILYVKCISAFIYETEIYIYIYIYIYIKRNRIVKYSKNIISYVFMIFLSIRNSS